MVRPIIADLMFGGFPPVFTQDLRTGDPCLRGHACQLYTAPMVLGRRYLLQKKARSASFIGFDRRFELHVASFDRLFTDFGGYLLHSVFV